MAITVGNITVASPKATPGSSLSVTTHNHNGDYLLVDVGEGYNETADATGATWNGVPMDFLGSVTDPGSSRKIYRYGLAGAATGTRTFVVTFGSSGDVSVMVTLRSFSGVNQTTPVGSTVTSTAIAATSISRSVSSAAGELVADAVGVQSGSTVTLTVGSGQTQTSNGSSGWGSVNLDSQFGTSYRDGAASVTMSWSVSKAKNLWMLATPLKPASGGTQYTQSVSGSISSSATLPKNISSAKTGTASSTSTARFTIAKATSAAITSAAALLHAVGKITSAAIATTAAVRNALALGKSGSIASASTAVVGRFFSIATSGGVAATGRVISLLGTLRSGVISPLGAAAKSLTKTLVGAITSAANVVLSAAVPMMPGSVNVSVRQTASVVVSQQSATISVTETSPRVTVTIQPLG